MCPMSEEFGCFGIERDVRQGTSHEACAEVSCERMVVRVVMVMAIVSVHHRIVHRDVDMTGESCWPVDADCGLKKSSLALGGASRPVICRKMRKIRLSHAVSSATSSGSPWDEGLHAPYGQSRRNRVGGAYELSWHVPERVVGGRMPGSPRLLRFPNQIWRWGAGLCLVGGATKISAHLPSRWVPGLGAPSGSRRTWFRCSSFTHRGLRG